MREMCRYTILLLLATLCSAAWAQSPLSGRPGLQEAVIAYGRMNLDAESGLVKDVSGRPNTVDSTVGFAVAALGGAEADRAAGRVALKAIMGCQDTQATSKTCGDFKWRVVTGAEYQPDATSYLAPLLAFAHVAYGPTVLGQDLDAEVLSSLRLALESLRRHASDKADGTTRLLQAAAIACAGRALGDPAAVAAGGRLVAAWGATARTRGVAEGYGPTYDALKVAAVRWAMWAGAGDVVVPLVDGTYRLLWLEFSQRVDASGSYLAGAIATAFQDDYLSARSIARYLIHYDLGGVAVQDTDPFAVYLLAPPVPALEPGAGQMDIEGPTLPHTVTAACDLPGAIARCDTYIAPDFTLGTMSGTLSAEAIPALVTYGTGGARPTSYFFLQGAAPATVSCVQSGGTAIVSMSFDQIGTGLRKQAWVEGILGPQSQIERVLLSGEQWQGPEVAVGEMSVLALQTRGCYLAVRPLHCGPAQWAQISEGPKPARLDWVGREQDADLRLRIYARQDTTNLQRPVDHMRAAFLVRVEPLSAYASLEDFALAVAKTRVTQTVAAVKVRVPGQSNDEKPPMLTQGKPQSRQDMVYKYSLIQTITYTSDTLGMGLKEDLLAHELQELTVNGKSIVASGPLSSPLLTLNWPGKPAAPAAPPK